MNPIKLKSCNFKIDKNNKIVNEVIRKRPYLLYKYYSFSDYNVKSLKDKTIHFSHFHKLNDPMDGNFILWDMESFDISFDQRIEIINKFLKCRGVFSMTETYTNELMWSHYCSNNGFCVGYDITGIEEFLNNNETELLIYPVSYGKIKTLKFKNHINCIRNTIDARLPMYYTFAVKNKCWDYENEWRMVIKDENFAHFSNPLAFTNDTEHGIENSSISKRNKTLVKCDFFKTIYLGTYFFNHNRFNNLIHEEANISKYSFRDNCNESDYNEKESLVTFFEIIKDLFENEIYQIDIINDKRFCKYKITIIEINSSFVKIKREEK